MKKLLILLVMLFTLTACNKKSDEIVDTTVCIVEHLSTEEDAEKYKVNNMTIFKSVGEEIIYITRIDNVYNYFSWRGITDMETITPTVNGADILKDLNDKDGFVYYSEQLGEGRYVIVQEHDLRKVPLSSLSVTELSFLNLSDIRQRALYSNLNASVKNLEEGFEGLLPSESYLSACFNQ